MLYDIRVSVEFYTEGFAETSEAEQNSQGH